MELGTSTSQLNERILILMHPKPSGLSINSHPAAILHDVLDKKYIGPEQASGPYSFFLPFFQRVKDEHGIDLIDDGRARQIALIIDNVSWTTEKKLRETGQWTKWHDECVELHCVQDADRLDAIGAFGPSDFFVRIQLEVQAQQIR